MIIDWVEQGIKLLQETAAYDDWDGKGSKAVSPLAIEHTRELMVNIAISANAFDLPRKLIPGDFSSDPPGSINIHWRCLGAEGKGETFLKININGSYTYYAENTTTKPFIFTAGHCIKDRIDIGLVQWITVPDWDDDEVAHLFNLYEIMKETKETDNEST